jgi:phosphatidylinositol glycan class U
VSVKQLLLALAAAADAPWLSPQQLSLLYLLNPFAVLACVAGSTISAENMGVMLAVAGGVTRNAPMAAAGVAVGAYMGLHPALLVVSACCSTAAASTVDAAADRSAL